MSADLFEEYVQDILHLVSQSLLTPTIVVLLALILFSLWCVGSIVVEALTERRHLKAALPELADAIDAAPLAEIDGIVDESGLLRRQKECLHEIVKHPQLPQDSLVALAKRLLADEQLHYDRKTARTDIATRISPMLGLMGTLIPLGPGIVALGQNNVTTLSSSLLIAFDTTVAGLLTAAVCYIVSRVRKGWYEDYMTTLEAALTCVLDKMTGGGSASALPADAPGDGFAPAAEDSDAAPGDGGEGE